MQNALLVGLSRQMALGRELDVIANNMANVTTNGFKARSTRFQDFLMAKASADSFSGRDRRLDFVIDAGTPLDNSSGAIETTGNGLDVAIKGDSFFVVQTPAGERFTRGGAFQVDATGQLVTNDGHPVLGDAGPIRFAPQETGAAIAQDGTVSTLQGPRGRLRLVRFDDVQALRNEGANTFSSATPPQPAGPTARLEPGALERSNVRPVLEMTRLMEVNRAYAGISSMLGRMDELRRSAMSRLADTSHQ
ncbi:flagellar basal-body rod protein FlgF [Enterovirga sp.]|uniref:flagellar basal-body rod protein FlgF n=1 Tax=Enterovirga sp. TaxID=2026350 RepID=UPI00263262FF|nr:flagellar basal-body rod protein FlgF [Enterovirga sp.]MDB5592187.1 flagellar basal-body rod protein FlgF [Enterovirga sp.]